ncbi:MAG: polymerase, sigma 70 subunit, RpoD subfamily [Pedosphaera sp.]|nr:polymerase, sigma 70 subunit, RpoD subfamily [Pedosphaera sp.]
MLNLSNQMSAARANASRRSRSSASRPKVAKTKPKSAQPVKPVKSSQPSKKPAKKAGSSKSELLVADLEKPSAQPEEVTNGYTAYDGNTAMTLYMREVGQVRLLTAEEEIELARKIKKGNAKAREMMIRANLRLVVKIAREYENLGLPLLDLVSEGNIGLMCAVERFDPSKGAKLSTYSSWWIKQSMRRALANQSKTIRLPVHMVDKIYNMRKTALKLQEVLGREPSDEELAAELGLTIRQVNDMRASSIRPTSLDAPIGDDDSAHLADIVRDENATSPYEQLEEKTVTDMLSKLVDRLQPREASILRFRFGLDGGQERTLEEVGIKFGVTRERIRQLQNLALRKLRKMIESLEAASTP